MSVTARTLNCIKDFRHAVIDSLKTANLPGIGQNVSASRKMKAWPEEESFIVVNLPGIEFDDKKTNPRFYYANSELFIDIYARSFLSDEDNIDGVYSDSDLNDFFDDTMHSVASVIEPCPFWRGPYQGMVTKCVLRSYSNNLSIRSETERGSARITFEVSFTAKIDRSAPEKDFLRAKNALSSDHGDPMRFETDLCLYPVITEDGNIVVTEDGRIVVLETSPGH